MKDHYKDMAKLAQMADEAGLEPTRNRQIRRRNPSRGAEKGGDRRVGGHKAILPATIIRSRGQVILLSKSSAKGSESSESTLLGTATARDEENAKAEREEKKGVETCEARATEPIPG